MSTLDQLTDGRLGWNIVTGYLDSAARAMGFAAQMAHDDRYDLADEFMAAVTALWEQSWDDDAVQALRGQYTDPAKVRPIHHAGSQYRIDAMALVAPTPQRTPVLYQAGTSTRGRIFAGRHAECVFVNGGSPADDRRHRGRPARPRNPPHAAHLYGRHPRNRPHPRAGQGSVRRLPRPCQPRRRARPRRRLPWYRFRRLPPRRPGRHRPHQRHPLQHRGHDPRAWHRLDHGPASPTVASWAAASNPSSAPPPPSPTSCRTWLRKPTSTASTCPAPWPPNAGTRSSTCWSPNCNPAAATNAPTPPARSATSSSPPAPGSAHPTPRRNPSNLTADGGQGASRTVGRPQHHPFPDPPCVIHSAIS